MKIRHWVVAVVAGLVAVAGVSVAVATARSEGPRGAIEAGELLNLEGNPVPTDVPLRLRLLVVDAGGFVGDGWIGLSAISTASRRLGRDLAAFSADMVVVFDGRLDGPIDDITSLERVAVETGTPWWARIVTQRREGARALAASNPERWGRAVVSSGVSARRPIVVAAHSETGAARAAAWPLPGPAPSGFRLVVEPLDGSGTAVTPAFELVDSPAQPIGTDTFLVLRGDGENPPALGRAVALATDDGRIQLALPADWVVEQSRAALEGERWVGHAMMVDLRRTSAPATTR